MCNLPAILTDSANKRPSNFLDSEVSVFRLVSLSNCRFGVMSSMMTFSCRMPEHYRRLMWNPIKEQPGANDGEWGHIFESNWKRQSTVVKTCTEPPLGISKGGFLQTQQTYCKTMPASNAIALGQPSKPEPILFSLLPTPDRYWKHTPDQSVTASGNLHNVDEEQGHT